MTTLKTIELTCPLCSNHLHSQSVLSTNEFGGKRTDFHPRAAGAQPIPYLIHCCPRCGYTGSERDFREEADLGPTCKARIWNEITPRVESGLLKGSDKYEIAALIATWRERGHREIADLYLRAAWCCVDEGDIEAERYYRRHAAWGLERALADYDGVETDERAVLTYLVGELWRRIGDTVTARAWYDRVETEITDPHEQQWVLTAARQQRDAPREWFG